MITADVRDWLSKQFAEFNDNIYNGRMFDTKREKLMSIKQGVSIGQQKAIGGMENTSYSLLACNCILHWNKSNKDTESKAHEIHEFLLALNHPVINGYKVVMVIMRNFVPIGTDENDIHEYGIDFEIMYMRKKALESEN